MNYGVCIVTYCVLFRVCGWIEFMYERCRNKNRKTAECCRHSAGYCMNCLRLPCRSDTSEIQHFSPFTFNKNMSPSKGAPSLFYHHFSRENKTVRNGSLIPGFVKMFCEVFKAKLALCWSNLPYIMCFHCQKQTDDTKHYCTWLQVKHFVWNYFVSPSKTSAYFSRNLLSKQEDFNGIFYCRKLLGV